MDLLLVTLVAAGENWKVSKVMLPNQIVVCCNNKTLPSRGHFVPAKYHGAVALTASRSKSALGSVFASLCA
jgi:hypothetical protein